MDEALINDDGDTDWRKFVTKVLQFLLQAITLPFIALWHRCRKLPLLVEPTEHPLVAFVSAAVSYVIFLVILSVRVGTSGPEKEVTGLDWVLLIYWISLTMQEIGQFRRQPREQYRQSYANWFDVLMIFLFFVYFITRIVGAYGGHDKSLCVSDYFLGFFPSLPVSASSSFCDSLPSSDPYRALSSALP